MIRRVLAALACAGAILIAGSGVASACGGLVAPGHAEVLQKATTLAAWHDGYEHYVTGFVFAGSASDFGYIVPLPGVPVPGALPETVTVNVTACPTLAGSVEETIAAVVASLFTVSVRVAVLPA